MREIILETQRLALRKLTPGDFGNLCTILQDEKAMYAYEHRFSDGEVQDWLDRQIERYKKDGFGLWAAELKETGAFVGQAGLTLQNWNDTWVPEIGYLLRRDCWHQGYATEAALGCKKYAFEVLKLGAVYSIIRDNNFASRRVAERNGMKLVGEMVKHYQGIDMPHLVYRIDRPL